MFSPMLDDLVSSLVATLTRGGLPTLVVDTLPATAGEGPEDPAAPDIAALAWRMRLVERSLLLADVAAAGCPVVPWRGPGTLDEVLRGFARSVRAPQRSR